MDEAILILADVLRTFLWVALIALSIALEWSIMRFPNFAIVDTAILSLLAGLTLFGQKGIFAVLAFSLCLYFSLRILMFLLVKRLVDREMSRSASIALALGFSLATVAVGGMALGNTPRRIPLFFNLELGVGRLALSGESSVAIVMGGLGAIVTYIFLVRTSRGRIVSLFNSNLKLARLSGAGAWRTEIATVIVSSLAAFCGVYAFATTQDIGPHDGGLPTGIGLCIVFLSKGRAGGVVAVALGFAALAWTLGQIWKVDLGISGALFVLAAVIVILGWRERAIWVEP